MHACIPIYTWAHWHPVILRPVLHIHMHNYVHMHAHTYVETLPDTCTCMHAPSHHHTCTHTTLTHANTVMHTHRGINICTTDTPPHTHSHMCMHEHTGVYVSTFAPSHMDMCIYILCTYTYTCEDVCAYSFYTHTSPFSVWCSAFIHRPLLHMFNNGGSC